MSSQPQSDDPYEILGLARTATQAEIKAAFRRLALRHHPDRNSSGNEERFLEVSEAHAVLSDPARRRRRDLRGGERPPIEEQPYAVDVAGLGWGYRLVGALVSGAGVRVETEVAPDVLAKAREAAAGLTLEVFLTYEGFWTTDFPCFNGPTCVSSLAVY